MCHTSYIKPEKATAILTQTKQKETNGIFVISYPEWLCSVEMILKKFGAN